MYEHRMYLVLGDWSDDGHGKYDKFLVDSNKTHTEIQDAYKASCKLTGFSFNHNDDFTGVERDYKVAGNYRICTEYEENFISEEIMEFLKEHNYPMDEFEVYEDKTYIDRDQFVELWFWFVRLSLPDMMIDLPNGDEIPCINGYWDKNLNVQFGYALYE